MLLCGRALLPSSQEIVMKLTALEDLFVHELNELYDAENQILKALPKMAKAVSRAELRRAFEDHYKETKTHLERLNRIFKALDEEPSKFKCDPITATIEQGETIIGLKSSDSAVLDAALITVAQKVEHYEIAAYGCARTHAALLGYEKISNLLAVTLDEEEKTDAKLTAIAKDKVNMDAGRAPYSKARTAPRLGEEQSSGAGKMLFGLGVGALIALLYAPKAGEEMREDLRRKANDSTDYIKRRSDEVRKQAGDMIEKGKQTVNEAVQRGTETGNPRL